MRMTLAHVKSVTLSLILASAAMSHLPEDVRAQSKTDGTIRGTVSSASGEPLYGILVTARGKGKNVKTSVFTQEDGRYEFPPLPLGPYQVSTGTAWQADATLTEAGVTQNFTVTLGPKFINQTSGASWFALMPGTEDEKKRAMAACGACHSTLRLFQYPRYSAAEWAEVGERMVTLDRHGHMRPPATRNEGYSVELRPQDFSSLTHYLANSITKDLIENHVVDALLRPKGEAARAVFTEWDLSASVGRSGVWSTWAAPNGLIWFGYEGKDGYSGVGHLDPATGQAKTWPSTIRKGSFHDIFGDADGNLWITASGANKIVRFNTKALKFTSWDTPKTSTEWPHSCDFDPEHFLWCTIEFGAGAIVKLDPRSGTVTEYPTKTKNGDAYGLVVDHDGDVWFTLKQASKIVKVDRHTGAMTEYALPTKFAGPRRVQVDSRGNLWLTEFYANQIAKLDPRTMAFEEYKVGPIGGPYFVKIDRDDKIWFNMTSGGTVGKFDPETKQFSFIPFPQAGTHVRDPSFDYSSNPFGIVYAVVSLEPSEPMTIGRMYVRK